MRFASQGHASHLKNKSQKHSTRIIQDFKLIIFKQILISVTSINHKYGGGISMENNDEKRYKLAQQRVGDIKKFYSDLIGYVVVNVILFIIDFLTSPGDWWFYWVTLIWGALLIGHAVKVFAFGGIGSKKWEEDKIKEMLDKENKSKE